MKMVYGDPQAYRCCHVPDCQAHIQCQCQEREKCTCNCSCKEFTAPSLTFSKVGAVLHLQWEEDNGNLFHLDCDLNVPTIPCETPYDGSIGDIAQYLTKEKPVNWLEELSKLENMGQAGCTYRTVVKNAHVSSA